MSAEMAKRKARNVQRDFTIRVLVDSREKTIHDVKRDGSPNIYSVKQYFLVPQQSSETTAFFDAWLPDVNEDPVTGHRQWPEVAVAMTYPVNCLMRAAVQRKSKDYPDAHHVIVMTRDVAEVLEKLKGKYLVVKVLAEAQTEKVLE